MAPIASSPLPPNFLKGVAVKLSGIHLAKQTIILSAINPVLEETLKAFGIDNDFRVSYFAGQCCEESDQFATTEEYASGAAYEGRKDLGNLNPGDGVRFKGRGLIQLTGHANYLHVGQQLGLDLMEHPELAADPVNALKIACFFWKDHGLSAFADLDDINSITRRVNGGLNGLAARQAATDRAFAALGYSAN